MRSHTPIGLAVAFYLIFIVIIFYLLSSLAIISHQHCSSLFNGSIAHGFSLIFAKVTFLIYRTSRYVQKNTKKVIFLKVKEFLKVKRIFKGKKEKKADALLSEE